MTDILNSNTLVKLKQICKFQHIKNYSGLRKNEIILAINKNNATLKLQRWIRKILSKNEECPISCESISYPCFAFKTPNNVLIYYNLDALRGFLIKSGDFRDPITRSDYTDKQLLDMDYIHNHYSNLHPTKIPKIPKTEKENYFNSVFKASKNKKFYNKLKDKEQEQLILERIMDSICDEIVTFIINNNNLFALNGLYLYDYQTQFRRLSIRSKKHAEYVINKNIENFNEINRKETSYNNNQCKLREYVIVFLYQLREELYLNEPT
jgi:hypothetical protein